MNVGIFNKVNLKSQQSDGMYEEWSSLPLEGGGRGVLASVGGRDVVLAVIRQVASNEPSTLTTDSEVEWVVEVIRYGLSLSLNEHEAVRECVRVCCSWLTPLLPARCVPTPTHPASPAVPEPVKRAPKHYARKILMHLHNLFVPRPKDSGDLISKQGVLCHRVLRLARSLAVDADLGAAEWRALLLLLLSAAAALLGPPAPHHTAADDLCDRVLSVLFEVWILACHRCFPSPPLWRTLREQCVRWRHRAALTEQWTRASLCLTARLLHNMYGPEFPALPIVEGSDLIPADMSPEAVTQSWYRMLHTIGNPVDLCRPHLISQTPHFLQYSITQGEGASDPSQHPCLQELPYIFHKAMRGVAAHVDAFLGVARSSLINLTGSRPSSVAPSTPPNSISSQVGETEKAPLAPLRPKVNSIFHLFGDWLFEASLIGTTSSANQQRTEGTPPPPLPEMPLKSLTLNYQLGRAEALGTVCRVLCSKQCREEVLAPYLARCYAAIHRGLKDPATAAATVLHSYDIFRLDLDGVLVLLPEYITALEQILPEREPKLECGNIDKKELRKAAISLLLSIVAFPQHYRGLPVPEFPGHNEYAGQTVGGLSRGRIAMLCVSGVQMEWQESLAAPLLSALYLTVMHNAHLPTGKAYSAPPGSTVSHSTEYKARSEGGSIAGSAEGHTYDEFSADATLDPASPNFGAALVVRATYLVCHHLISSWKSDLQVSLTALELLSGLAKLHSDKGEASERKRAVRWLCDYITVQCSRPRQAHSRDLHSCVVAAFASLASWLSPALLADHGCRDTLMEVVELGISGAKSVSVKPDEPPKMKDTKELKPVSMRVQHAAESLLMLILEQSESGIGLTGGRCRLDERWLSALGAGKARHVAVDGILYSLLEEPLANEQHPQPSLLAVIRSGWSRSAWALVTRGLARCAAKGGGATTRPLDVAGPPAPRSVSQRPMHAHYAHGGFNETAFPSLESVLSKLKDPDAHTLFKLLEQQAAIEKRVQENESNTIPEEYVPPEPVTEFQTARLFLSNFGYLNIGGVKKALDSGVVSLDSSAPGFSSALRRVDSVALRACVTAHVFCVRTGQAHAHQILRAPNDGDLPNGFLHMLKGLGNPVRVSGHPGWSGHVDTSYDAPYMVTEEKDDDAITPSIYDGRRQVLYWSDETTEIAIVVPSDTENADTVADNLNRSDVDGNCCSNRSTEKQETCSWDVSSNSSAPSYERSVSEVARSDKRPLSDKSRALSLDLDKQSGSTGISSSGRRNVDYSTKILIFWLEDYEDHHNLPIDELLNHCDTGLPWRRQEVCLLYISALRNGLILVRVNGAGGVGAGPLADGAVLGPKQLPLALRRSVADIAARRRHCADDYQPPHVRRRHLIQELVQKYKKNLTEPELWESLFQAPA